MKHEWGEEEMHSKFWLENLKCRDYLGGLKHQIMDMCEGLKVKLHAFLTSALSGCGYLHATAGLPLSKEPHYPVNG
jgi:hypothetical protein